jgi:hypothetical protein
MAAQLDVDVVYVVTELLAKAQAPVSLSELQVEVPFDRRKVAAALFALASCGFLIKEGANDQATFCVAKTVTAYHIIKLGEMGVDMGALSSWIKISDRQRQAAMALAVQTEKLAELDEESRARRAEASAKLAGPVKLPRDSMVDMLERLALASDLSIQARQSQGPKDEVLTALQEAREQAMKALAKYQEQLGSAGAEHLGF